MLILKNPLKNCLKNNGFIECGAIDLNSNYGDSIKQRIKQFDFASLKGWLSEGRNAEMKFMEKNEEARLSFEKILPESKTLIMLLVPYATGTKIRGDSQKKQYNHDAQNQKTGIAPFVARYAHVKDYHKCIKKSLTSLFSEFLSNENIESQFRVLVDSVPFFERAWARESGLGFVGKNTMLIRPGIGSFFFICGVVLNCSPFVLAERVERQNRSLQGLTCGDCTKCIDACPTSAILAGPQVDARKCISYLTIEHRKIVEEKYLQHFKDHIYGCDICQEVCPYNLKTLDLVKFKDFLVTHKSLEQLTPLDVARMTPTQYESWFASSPMTRAKYSGLVRNAIYHLMAAKNPELLNVLSERSSDPDALILAVVQQVKRCLEC